MKDGPLIASVAALLGDPARANILTALMDGRALTASELAHTAGITQQTASSHLEKLTSSNLLTVQKQGRHRYFSLSGADVAQVLEALMGLAQRTGAVRLRTGPKDAALRTARICYDHLAGERGVELLAAITSMELIAPGDHPVLTQKGRDFFTGFGIDIATLEQARRPICRHCLDWSERRLHLAGTLGAAILTQMAKRNWITREAGRIIKFTPNGGTEFAAVFGVT